MLQVTVKRSEWNGNQVSNLVHLSSLCDRATGKMCCLGFAAVAAGIRQPLLWGRAYVHELRVGDLHEALLGLIDEDKQGDLVQSRVSRILTEVNDNSPQSDHQFSTLAEKEAFLTVKGREVGIEFTFVD